ncbi:MAG: serine hydrolase domain-containing protein [Acidobacteriaceae bacterium]
MQTSRPHLFALLPLIFCLSISALAQSAPAPAAPAANLEQQLDHIVPKVLADTGVPSASIAIVQDGRIVLLKAYGDAKLNPPTPAKPTMRYGIGSISKQFTAAAIMMLVQDGKLSLDDHVGKYLPDLTRANEVTVRELLSHTAGYQDDFPQDYLPAPMKSPTTAQYIMDTWAKKPLDFGPGTRWQYSNTGFTIAGAILEKVSGMKLIDFLDKNIFKPLDMKSAVIIDADHPSNLDVEGYYRHALGPARPAPLEAPGWLAAAGELMMTAEDLAKWDISVMNESLLKPSSYKTMETENLLRNGLGTRYGLGMQIVSLGTHRELEHGGEIIGFVSDNIVLPDDKASVSVLTNMDASSAASSIARQVAQILVRKPDPNGNDAEARARKVFEGLQHGQIDRSQFTSDANGYFDQQALQDFANSLGPLGEITSFTANPPRQRGGMTARTFIVGFKDKSVEISTYETKDGKYEQFLVLPVA